MKANLFKALKLCICLAFALSCKKEEKLNVDLDTYSGTTIVNNTPLDQWLKLNFLDKYNTQVNYRYNSYAQTSVVKDVGPVEVSNVQPYMQALIDGMLIPYEKAAGLPFIKKFAPREINIFGSSEYSTGESLRGLAFPGGKMNLYYVNNYLTESAAIKTQKLRTIHHEFTHLLNQIVARPTEFDIITNKYYSTASYTSAAVASAYQGWGFVTAYATTNAAEDFAETVAALLGRGQAWFDDWANGSTAEGKIALKAKETEIVKYFKNSLKCDFRILQKEVQNVIRNGYKNEEALLPFWLGKNFFKTITINLDNNNIYIQNAMPNEFANVYNSLKAGIAAKSATAKYRLDYLQFRFTSGTELTVRVPYTATAGNNTNTQYSADFNFSYVLNTTTGELTFTKTAQAGTTGNYASASLIANEFLNSVQAYLTGKTFVVSWLPDTIDAENYNNYGGFYLKGTPADYVYGLLGQTL